MNSIFFAFRFGWPFLKKYRLRFFGGVLFGVLFGLCSGVVLFGVKTMAERMTPDLSHPAQVATATAAPSSPAVKSEWRQQMDHLKGEARAELDRLVDEWLPKVGQSMTWKQALGCVLLLPLVTLVRGACSYLNGYCLQWVSERCHYDMQQFVLQRINLLSIDYFDRSKTGDIMQRINGDTLSVYTFFRVGVADLIKQPAAIVGSLTAMLYVDWKLTLIATVIMIPFILPVRILGKKTLTAARSQVDTEVKFGSFLVEAIANMRMVKAFSLESFIQKRYRDFRTRLISASMRRNRAEVMMNPLLEVMSVIGVSVVLLYVFFSGTEIPQLITFAMGMAMMANPIKSLANINLVLQKARVGVERLQQTLQERSDTPELPEAAALPDFNQAIALEQVDFSYGRADLPVLRKINLTIKKGTKIGIAGESGSGKSTLISLLFRFYDPKNGAVKIDGHDLRQLTHNSLRTQMALVGQEVLLFDDTIGANISLGKADATREEIIAAAKAAHAHDFITSMPQGYDTIVGERGVRLSGGQRQRLSIARAFIRNAPILILDEATAALDSQAEAEVQKAIDELSAHRTVVMIAHRLSTLKSCDQVVVLERGEIVEQGGFDELLKQGGRFAKMAARQGIKL
ncbi:MAG: ABC transporter ATP-binding protein/permease [Verrucomicrobiales bacterium]|jgi:subfamily B ATP-binding cassette protein MsbA|nr:ABC transporter ATP-binding protein/permease [Verrucomicrobiales bacterium]